MSREVSVSNHGARASLETSRSLKVTQLSRDANIDDWCRNPRSCLAMTTSDLHHGVGAVA